MIIPNEHVRSHLLHWSGEKQLQSPIFTKVEKNLEGNVESTNILDSFGDSTISAYVGFIDLAGFSSAVQGMSPKEIADYLDPFLSRTTRILANADALVDKMIGDELMFVLPEYPGAGEGVARLRLGQLLGALHGLAFEDSQYCFRIGLSYGPVYLYHLVGDGYSEWSVVGEPIHVAKRLHGVSELESPDPVCGAYGLSLGNITLDAAKDQLKVDLGIVAGFASRFTHQLKEEPVEFKGVGSVVWAYLHPKDAQSDDGT